MKTPIVSVVGIVACLAVVPLPAQVAAPAGPARGAAPGAQAVPPEVQAAMAARAAELAQLGETPRGPLAAVTTMPVLATSTLPGGAGITLQNLSEMRGTLTGQISIGIGADDNVIPQGGIVRRTTITKAEDDRGRSLLSTGARGSAASNIALTNSVIVAAMRGGAAGARAGARGARGSGALRNSMRDATSIKVLEGEFEVYLPSGIDGSVITITDLPGKMGKRIEDPVLAREGIQLTLVTAETYPEFKAQVPPGPIEPNFNVSTVIHVVDPNGKLAALVFQDANGMPMVQGMGGPLRGVQETGMLLDLRVTPAPSATAKLLVYLSVPEAVRTIPFRFENIPLP